MPKYITYGEIVMTMAVYTIRCVKNDKVYVGSSVSVERRWSQHKCDLSAGIHHSWKLQKAWDEYGSEHFSFEMIDTSDDKICLRQLEADYRLIL